MRYVVVSLCKSPPISTRDHLQRVSVELSQRTGIDSYLNLTNTNTASARERRLRR